MATKYRHHNDAYRASMPYRGRTALEFTWETEFGVSDGAASLDQSSGGAGSLDQVSDGAVALDQSSDGAGSLDQASGGVVSLDEVR